MGGKAMKSLLKIVFEKLTTVFDDQHDLRSNEIFKLFEESPGGLARGLLPSAGILPMLRSNNKAMERTHISETPLRWVTFNACLCVSHMSDIA